MRNRCPPTDSTCADGFRVVVGIAALQPNTVNSIIPILVLRDVGLHSFLGLCYVGDNIKLWVESLH